MASMSRHVTARIVCDVTAPADLVFAVAAAGHHDLPEERLVVTADDVEVPVREVDRLAVCPGVTPPAVLGVGPFL
jgi:hypothetical protein